MIWCVFTLLILISGGVAKECVCANRDDAFVQDCKVKMNMFPGIKHCQNLLEVLQVKPKKLMGIVFDANQVIKLNDENVLFSQI